MNFVTELIAANPKWLYGFMLGAGILLIMVPRWIRWAIAVTMIAVGLSGLFPELIPATPPTQT